MLRILLTGGGSGGHIYPLVAVADELQKIDIGIELFYLGPKNNLNAEFYNKNIKVKTILSSKLRRYFSISNIFDFPKFIISIFQAIFKIYRIMPDVVFSKGGPGALPVVLAARFYFIPVIIHESDAIPGLTNKISGFFAKRIGISFPEAESYFPKNKTALVGNPVRKDLIERKISKNEAKSKLHFEIGVPLVLVLGGSQGSQEINNFVFENIKELLEDVQILHQVGDSNLEEGEQVARSALRGFSKAVSTRYRPVGYLDVFAMADALSAADIVISRAGAGAIFEIAAFKKPVILVPLNSSAHNHQKANAYEYSKFGGGIVIEGENLKTHIVLLKIKEMIENDDIYRKYETAAERFSKLNSAEIIASEIIKIGMYKKI